MLNSQQPKNTWAGSVIFFVLVLFFCRPIEDYDIWFHMVVGREIVESGKIPDQMFYLLPLMGEPRVFMEWGAGLAYHLAHTLGGFIGMALLNATLGATALFVVYRAAVGSRSLLNPAAIFALALIAYWIKFRINYRAEGFLYLALGLEIWVLERYLNKNNWHWLALIPVLSCVLAQIHPTVILFIPILGAYAVDQFIKPSIGQSRVSVLTRFSLTGIAILAAACANPYGWHQVVIPFKVIFSTPEVIADLTEFAPIMNTNLSNIYLVAILVGLITIIFQPQRRVAYALLLAFFGVMSFLYVRNFGLFCLIALAPAVRLAHHIFPATIKPAYQYALTATILIALIITPLWQGEWGVGQKSNLFPQQAVSRLKKDFSDGGNVLNFFDYGGYLAWSLPSSFKVFVDGSDTKLNRAVQLHDGIFRADPGWENELARYKIDAIFTPAIMQFSGKHIPLVEQLSSDNEWVLVSRESSGMLFLRNTANVRDTLDKQQIWEQMVVESEREIKAYPTHPDSWESLAMAHYYLGNTAQSEQAAQQYRRLIAGNAIMEAR